MAGHIVKLPVIVGGVVGDGYGPTEAGIFMGVFVVATGVVDATDANTSEEEVFTVAGLKAGDIVLSFVKPTSQAGLGVVGSRVSADDTLAVTYMNTTAAPVTASSEDCTLIILRVNQ